MVCRGIPWKGYTRHPASIKTNNQNGHVTLKELKQSIQKSEFVNKIHTGHTLKREFERILGIVKSCPSFWRMYISR